MSPSKRSLCLILRAAPTKALDAIRAKLRAAGFELVAVTKPENGVISVAWLDENIPTHVQGWLFIDEKLEAVGAFCERLKTLQSPWRHVPVFYAFHSPKRLADLEQGELPAIADFFSLTEPPTRIALRLQMRLTEYKDRAAIYRTAQEQSMQLAKIDTALKQREEFLGVCAHDLRSPLGLIQTCLSMVLKSPEAASLKPIYGELLGRAQRQSEYALTLVKDLLDVMALEQGLKPQYQVLRLHDLLNDFFSDYGFQAQQKNVKFHYFNPVQEWRVLADSERIKQLLQNLFTNALKFTEPGKNIYLSVAPFQGRRTEDPPYPMVVISLKDEGKGIPHSEMQKIFDRFVQIKEHSREGGRGLGLTVAKQISTLHDGNIWVESEEGRGSTFFVLFPHTLSRAPSEPKTGEPKKILVAEPNEQKRKTLFGKLQTWGYDVAFAKDGVEAITLFYHLWPDALVLTPELSKIPSTEVTNLLRTDPRANDIPILLATSQAPAPKSRTEGILVDAFLPSPFTQAQWKQVLENVMKPGKKAA